MVNFARDATGKYECYSSALAIQPWMIFFQMLPLVCRCFKVGLALQVDVLPSWFVMIESECCKFKSVIKILHQLLFD